MSNVVFVKVSEEVFNRFENSKLFSRNQTHIDIGLDENVVYVTTDDTVYGLKHEYRLGRFYVTNNLINFLEE